MALAGPVAVASTVAQAQRSAATTSVSFVRSPDEARGARGARGLGHATLAFCSALAAVVGARRRTVRRGAKASRCASENEKEAEAQNFLEVQRRAALGLSAAVCSACGGGAAFADYEVLNLKRSTTGCTECDSTGLVGCSGHPVVKCVRARANSERTELIGPMALIASE
ncbi:unnamed protein product [Cladocopium goreaui]|uniref:Uncharacterized protein n=1 Tax=Cladocopium goreaui TaxID=2562237 RepID=A0A9P1C1F3_9DINO|nr:unnamed protein product [Cladocopium goreaui]